ncbi:MAG: NAD-dependent epimerase/dehydratase family protein [Ginsengibacter sp.]
MQTILGAGGAVAIELAKELKKYTNKIRLVARNPKKVNDDDELFLANLLDKKSINDAVEGSDIVYLTAGLEYNIKIWRRDWPVIMRNVIDACIAHNAKLVFFDNVYMYAPEEIPHMTEESPIAPATEKGKVRAELIKMIFDAIEKRKLTAMVTRSADFYGKNVKTGFLNIGVIDNFKKNKKAFWQSDANKIHSFTYVPDAAKAVALLGNTPDAYNQVWHLPTSSQKWTGKEFVNYIAKQMHIKPRYYILSKLMISLFGMFSATLRELKEMQYQNDRDYFFDSSKFQKKFVLQPTTYEKGIADSIE